MALPPATPQPSDLPALPGAIVRAAGRAVPRRRRASWRREWEAELTWAWHMAARDGKANRLARARLTGRALWSGIDAIWVLREEITMQRLAADVRLALRGLRRSPGFTAVTLLTLALGIGANTAIFSVVNGVLLKPLPYADSERLLSVNFTMPGLGYPIVPFSDGMFFKVRDLARSLEHLAMYGQDSVNLVGEGDPERVAGAQVTPSFFNAIGTRPHLGRLFNDADAEPGAEPVALLAHELWSSRYGSDPDTVGRVEEFDGVMRRVVGILPPGFDILDDDTRVWRPFELDEANANAGSFSFPGMARLAPGATLDTVQADLEGIIARMGELFPDEFPQDLVEQAQFAPRVKPLKEEVVGDVRQPLMVILGTVGLVLLIACANVANLFLVRSEGRQREVTLRSALGARGLDLVRFYLTESTLLALGGGVLGVGVAVVAVRAFTALAPVAIPRIEEIGVDGRVLGFSLGISLLAGLLFGSVPILRGRSRDLATALREGGRGTTAGRGVLSTRNALVVAQVALALVLLVGAGLMMRSFSALRATDLGFRADGVVAVQIALPGAEYPGAVEREVFWRSLSERFAAIPGVTGVGAINGLPLEDSRSAGGFRIEDQPTEEGALPPLAEKRRVLPGYFETMGVPLLEGRLPSDEDAASGRRSVAVSTGLASHWWGDGSAIGKRIREDEDEDWFEIVGVVGDVHFVSLQVPAEETIYFPLLTGSAEEPDVPSFLSLVLRTAVPETTLTGAIRQATREVDPRLPIARQLPVARLVAQSMARTSFTLVMLGIASSVALFLGSVGIYGVISYLVSQRTAEIGVRIALGAPAGLVRRMVVNRGMTLAGVGIGVGLAGALTLSSVIAALLYNVSATDPVTYVAVAVMLAVTALLASWVPAVRASRLDPVEALRAD